MNDSLDVDRVEQANRQTMDLTPLASPVLWNIAFWLRHRSEELSSGGNPTRLALQAHKAAERFEGFAQQFTPGSVGDFLQLRELRPDDKQRAEEWLIRQAEADQVTEKKYGVMRLDSFRSKVMTLLREGKTGTVVMLDLVALNALNTYGDEKGDEALRIIAGFAKDLLRDFGVDSPEFFVGRRGDEFYAFVSDENANEVAEKVKMMYKERDGEGRLWVKVTEEEKRKAIFYWGVAEVNMRNFDAAVAKLEESVERAKISATSLVIAELQNLNGQGGRKNEERLVLLLSFLKEKRIPVEIVEMLIVWGHEALAQMIEDSSGAASNRTEVGKAMEWLKRVKDPSVTLRVRKIVEKVATEAGFGVIVPAD